MINKMMTVDETAKMLKVSERTLYRLIERGKIGVVRVTARNILIPERDVNEYLASQYNVKEGASNGTELG